MTQAYPLKWPEGWPRNKYPSDPYSRFGHNLTLARAADGIYHELSLLGAKSIVLSTNVQPRLDGTPRSGQAQPMDTGAAVYFTYNDQQLSMACDRWSKIEANVRALALAVSHLRGLERHGGGFMMKRAFTGFTALPPPAAGAQADPVEWREEFQITVAIEAALDGDKAGLLALCERRYRQAASAAHSDKGGDDTRMIRLNAAIAEARKDLGNG